MYNGRMKRRKKSNHDTTLVHTENLNNNITVSLYMVFTFLTYLYSATYEQGNTYESYILMYLCSDEHII